MVVADDMIVWVLMAAMCIRHRFGRDGAPYEVAWALRSLSDATIPLDFYEAIGDWLAAALFVMTSDWKHGKAVLISY